MAYIEQPQGMLTKYVHRELSWSEGAALERDDIKTIVWSFVGYLHNKRVLQNIYSKRL